MTTTEILLPLPAHEYADLFPMLPDADLKTLADDIKANGQHIKITILDGKILDGRNRHRACKIAGVMPIIEEYAGTDPLGFVISHNLHRRHLSDGQRAMVANKLANLEHGANQHKKDAGIPASSITQPEAAEKLNVTRDAVQQARRITSKGIPELAEAVESGKVSLNAAAKVANLPKEEQAEIVSKGPQAVKQAAKRFRDSKKQVEPTPEPETEEEVETLIIDGIKETVAADVVEQPTDDICRRALLQLIDVPGADKEVVLLHVISTAEKMLEQLRAEVAVEVVEDKAAVGVSITERPLSRDELFWAISARAQLDRVSKEDTGRPIAFAELRADIQARLEDPRRVISPTDMSARNLRNHAHADQYGGYLSEAYTVCGQARDAMLKIPADTPEGMAALRNIIDYMQELLNYKEIRKAKAAATRAKNKAAVA